MHIVYSFGLHNRNAVIRWFNLNIFVQVITPIVCIPTISKLEIIFELRLSYCYFPKSMGEIMEQLVK